MATGDFERRWQAIKRRGDALPLCAARLGLKINWDGGNPFDAAAPPASEAEVRAVERATGRALPLTLRQLFREGSAKVDFAWRLPYRIVTGQHGYPDRVFDLMPPPPFQEKRSMGGLTLAQPIDPTIHGGGLFITLDEVAPLSRKAEGWARHYDNRARTANDEVGRIHSRQRAEMWRRIVPFFAVEGRDMMGVDGGDPDEPVIEITHEDGDCAVRSYGRSLLEYLEHASRLGFVWHSLIFKDDATSRVLAARCATERPDAASLGLPLFDAEVISADSANGRLWRAWLDRPEN